MKTLKLSLLLILTLSQNFISLASSCNLKAQIVTTGDQFTMTTSLIIDPQKYYRLSTLWQGPNKCLDLQQRDGKYYLLLKNKSTEDSQLWKLTQLQNGYIRITNKALGQNYSIDVINDGTNDKVWMAQTGNYSGQMWKFDILNEQLVQFRLTTLWLGQSKSLDIINDGVNNNQPHLADTGDYSGQYWNVVDEDGNNIEFKYESSAPKVYLSDMIVESIQGFRILINPYYAQSQGVKLAKQRLTDELKQLTEILQPQRLCKMRAIPIAIQITFKKNAIAWFHVSTDWLVENGYSREFVNTIQIVNGKYYYQSLKQQKINTMLHELSHGYRYIYLNQKLDKLIQGYEKAMQSGLYDSVDYILGGKTKHYATTNAQQFFAEMSQTYFYKNDFYPWTKQDLKQYDPDTYSLMEELLKIQ